MRFLPRTLTRSGAPANRYSSSKMACSTTLAPRPPYSTGHRIAPYPALPSSRSHSRCASKPSRVPADGSDCGAFAASHEPTPWRNASCSGV